jgi:maltooligosyltrehalose trehalohydrolase
MKPNIVSMNHPLGALYFGEGQYEFCVWAPLAEKVEVHLLAPKERLVPLKRADRGYHQAVVQDIEPGRLYFYRLNGKIERPDPASRSQPDGVDGPSQVVDSSSDWADRSWSGPTLQDYVVYELHVGAFTPEGTFDAIVPHLPELTALGVTAIELMPVAQFPGSRNWGYDGVFPFAVQNSYGEPEGLRRLVNACHQQGLAVVLDVVYNHLGPEGNYFGDFAPYFTDRYRTPWGPAVNFDGPHSDGVRYFFVQNALYWLTEFHIDSLRLDAVHAIVDTSGQPFLRELAAAVHGLGERLKRRVYLFAESDRNDTIFIRSPESGGYGLDALWNDDFHHALHVSLTGERSGYYQDFTSLNHLGKAFTDGFVYTGQYSTYRQRRFGISSREVPASRLMVFAQNHDQVGNRMLGERLTQIVSFEGLKLAAGVVLLSPFIPLLFMGEEYGETAPFLYFTSHSDPVLIEAVQRGRHEEFASFRRQGAPPDPQNETTFLRTKLNHGLVNEGQHHVLLEFYKKLIRLRREVPALSCLSKDTQEVRGFEKSRVLFVRRWNEGSESITVCNFREVCSSVTLPIPLGRWQKRLDSAESRWLGKGSHIPEKLNSDGDFDLDLTAKSFVLLTREVDKTCVSK